MNKVSLFEICTPKQWPTIPISSMKNKGYPVYGANGRIGYYSEYNHEFSTIMITCRGATCGSVNVSEPYSYITGNAMSLDSLDKNVYQRYLYHYLTYRGFKDVISGTAQPQITRVGLSQVKIPLPPLEEQKRIAAILDKADALRQKRRESIRLLDEFLRSVFLDMFGDPVTNPKGWEELPLEKTTPENKIITYGIVQAGPHVEDGVPYLKSSDIVDGIIRTEGLSKTSREIAKSYERSKVNKGDIILSIRATVGTCGILPDVLDGANLTQGTARISCGKLVLNKFLLWMIRTKGFQCKISRETKGITFKEITLGRLRKLKAIIPPIDLQQEFVDIENKTSTLKHKLNSSAIELEKQFNSLVQRAFRGEL